jgi:GT2 family glycosyltransferase
MNNFLVYSIVVTYNGSQWVQKCFKSLVESDIANHQILVIDNGSTDNTLKIIKEKFNSVKVIQTGENLGFGKANNIGIKLALDNKAGYVFLLNQDAWIEKDTITELIKIQKANPDFGILSPMQHTTSGQLDYRFVEYFNKSKSFNDEIRSCKFVNAAGWLISRECLKKTGGFSELFYHYGEDIDYCNRTMYHQFKIGIVTSTNFIHDRPQIKDQNKNKNLRLETVNQIAHLSNINYNILILWGAQIYFLFKSIIDKKMNFKLLTKGILTSNTYIIKIFKYRSLHKKESAFLNSN